MEVLRPSQGQIQDFATGGGGGALPTGGGGGGSRCMLNHLWFNYL